jgi:hypothetical protein
MAHVPNGGRKKKFRLRVAVTDAAIEAHNPHEAAFNKIVISYAKPIVVALAGTT